MPFIAALHGAANVSQSTDDRLGDRDTQEMVTEMKTCPLYVYGYLQWKLKLNGKLLERRQKGLEHRKIPSHPA